MHPTAARTADAEFECPLRALGDVMLDLATTVPSGGRFRLGEAEEGMDVTGSGVTGTVTRTIPATATRGTLILDLDEVHGILSVLSAQWPLDTEDRRSVRIVARDSQSEIRLEGDGSCQCLTDRSAPKLTVVVQREELLDAIPAWFATTPELRDRRHLEVRFESGNVGVRTNEGCLATHSGLLTESVVPWTEEPVRLVLPPSETRKIVSRCPTNLVRITRTETLDGVELVTFESGMLWAGLHPLGDSGAAADMFGHYGAHPAPTVSVPRTVLRDALIQATDGLTAARVDISVAENALTISVPDGASVTIDALARRLTRIHELKPVHAISLCNALAHFDCELLNVGLEAPRIRLSNGDGEADGRQAILTYGPPF